MINPLGKMAKSTCFNIVLLHEDEECATRATRYARALLDTIEAARNNASFDVRQHPVRGDPRRCTAQAHSEDVLKSCKDADAVLALGCEEVTELQRLFQLDLKLHRLSFVADRLGNAAVDEDKVYEELDFELLCSNTLKQSPATEHQNHNYGISVNNLIPETAKRLALCAGSFSMRHSPPKQIVVVNSTVPKANDETWKTSIFENLREQFPQLEVTDMPARRVSQLVSQNSSSLKNILLVSGACGDALLQDIVGTAGWQSSTAFLRSTPHINACSVRPKVFVLPGQELRAQEPSGLILSICNMLDTSLGLCAEAGALVDAWCRTTDPISRLGSNMRSKALGGNTTEDDFMAEVVHHFRYFLEAVNSIETVKHTVPSSAQCQPKKPIRPMGLIEKILTHAAIGLDQPEVFPGQMVCVSVDWVLTSELLWAGMEKTYNKMQRPAPRRNDRIWLAVDHTVDPRTKNRSKQKALLKISERFRDEAKIINYLPANTSIMHTDFTREKAQPGHIVVGSDSHTCSAGSMGSLAVGFGAADVVMPLVTGETWFRVPQVCRINFVGSLPYGVTGKDVILYILGLFKRNTIALQRAVEYGGPGLRELSMDARFAIANMTTEFGGMGACFEADEVTARWIAKRRSPKDRHDGIYFKPDREAEYAEERTIDLSDVEVTMALYPNPDDVVPISEKAGMKLDGCFIGACTTTEEELILAALVLEAGLGAGLAPVRRGKRRVTPGSLIIIERLEKAGLLSIFEEAGFDIGAPGCSYCVGINDVDVAQPGEVWLSSQNRNFKNRMGKGSIGNITCAAAVAASSFKMEVTDPEHLLNLVDKQKYERFIKLWKTVQSEAPKRQEPSPILTASASHDFVRAEIGDFAKVQAIDKQVIRSKIQRFEENVDTDAIIPAEFMPGVDNVDLGTHCFEYSRPEFRARAANGARIIVATDGFGSGSSREDAVRALQGAGVEAVIAKSFAFIYERNQLNMGLFNVVMLDEEFYALASEGRILTIDKREKTLSFEGSEKVFRYQHSAVEETLLCAGGILNLYNIHGRSVFREIIKATPDTSVLASAGHALEEDDAQRKKLDW